MNIAFKYFMIQAGGTPQPLIGTFMTAAVTTNTVQQSLNINGDPAPVTLTVNDSSMFRQGDFGLVTDPGTFFSERFQVYNQPPNATTIQVIGLTVGHPGGVFGTGAFISLGTLSQSVFVQALDGNTGALFIGVSPQLVKATGAFVLAKCQAVTVGNQPYEFSTSRQGLAETETASQYWIDGTTGDSYLPSLGVV